MKPYRFLKEAVEEFNEQIRYFEQQVAGLGDKFLVEVESSIRLIREFPETGAPVSRFLRKRVLRGFPHSVFYVNSPDEILIVAVAAHRRRPGYWRGRMGSVER